MRLFEELSRGVSSQSIWRPFGLSIDWKQWECTDNLNAVAVLCIIELYEFYLGVCISLFPSKFPNEGVIKLSIPLSSVHC